MKLKIVLGLFVFFILNGIAQATEVDYPELAIEQRRHDLTAQDRVIPLAVSAKESEALEAEKTLVTQQLSVITGDEDTKYVIVPGDTVEVTYKDQGKLIKNVFQVNGKGEIVLSLVGPVKITGLNRGDARSHLNEVLSEYIRDPQLSVEINASGKYIVLGAAGPGTYPLEANMTMMDAILRAGYDSRRTNLATVMVMRGDREKPTILKLNLKKMMVKGDRTDNIPVKPNDLIYIPNTFFYDFEAFKDKVFTYILDYYTLGGSTIIKRSQTKGSTEP